MKLFPNSTSFIAIGNLTIQWYAIIILIGAFVAYTFIKKDLKEKGYDGDVADDLFIGVLFCGIVGARLWFCLFWDAEYYFTNIMHLLDIRGGGLAIQGGIIGGTLFIAYYVHKHKINFLRMMDCVLPNVLIAQSIGRWGNFINKEAYGRIVEESAMKIYPSFIKDGMYIDGAYRQPTFLWESVMNLIGFLLIRFVYKKYGNGKRGDLTFLYLIWYGCVRFVIEGFRTDNLMFLGYKMSQVTALCFAIVGVAGFIFVRVHKNKTKPVVLFDLDGTLLDTQPAIFESYRTLFAKYRKEEDFTPEIQMEVLGPSLSDMFKKYFPDQDTDKLIEEYREVNKRVHPDVVKPMDHCEDLLKYLKENGYKTGVVSTKKKEMCQYGLSLFDLEKYIDVFIGPEDVTKGKPDPEGILKACKALNAGHDDLVYVGDSPTDIKACKAVGGYSIGYVHEEKRKEALLDTKPDKVIEDLIEIEDILKENHSWSINMM